MIEEKWNRKANTIASETEGIKLRGSDGDYYQ